MTSKGKNRLFTCIGYLILGIGCLGVLLPLSWMVITSLKSMADITLSRGLTLFPSGPTLENFVNIWKEYPIATYIKNSIVAVGGSTVIGVVCAALCGYGLSRYQFKGKAFLLSFLLVTQMFPAVMKIIPYYKILVSVHLNNTQIGLMVVYASFSIPFCTWMMKGFFDSIPVSLEEAAKVDGAGRFRCFATVVMPLTIPGLVATGLFSFITGWNEYLFASTFMKSYENWTLPIGIASFQGQYATNWGTLMAGAVLITIPVVILFLALQKHLVGGMTAGAVKQ